VEDAAGSLDLRYGPAGEVVEERRTVLGKTYVTGFATDLLGRRTAVQYPDGFIVRYEYGPDGSLSRVTDDDGNAYVGGMSRNAAGSVEAMEFGNGVRTMYTWDESQRATSLRAVNSAGTLIQGLDWTYDATGNVLSLSDAVVPEVSQSFAYDDLDRLVEARGAYGHETYEYDLVGNLVRNGSLVMTVDPLHPQRIIHGVETAAENRSGRNEFDIAYDDRGNVIAKGNRRFVYDAENRLVRIEERNGRLVAENLYDFAGQRVVQRTPRETTVYVGAFFVHGKTKVTRNVWGGTLVASVITQRSKLKLIKEADLAALGVLGAGGGSSGWPLAALALALFPVGVLVRRGLSALPWRTWADGWAEIGKVVRLRPGRSVTVCASLLAMLLAQLFVQVQPAQAKNGPKKPKQEVFYYHADHLGSINVVTDTDGRVVSRRQFKPYGETHDWSTENSGPSELAEGFGGHLHDSATGLIYYGARHYDPQLGRFLSADTIQPKPLELRSFHRYAYANGNPVRFVDPDGHWSWPSWNDVECAFKDVGSFFTDSTLGRILGAAILIVAITALTIVTAGAAAGLYVVLGAALGGAAFAVGGAAAGLRGEDLLTFALAGAVLGAALAGAVAVAAAGAAASTTTAGLAAKGAVYGMAAGSLTATGAHVVAGRGRIPDPDALFASVFFETVIGGVTGAAFGAAFGKAAQAVGRAKGYAQASRAAASSPKLAQLTGGVKNASTLARVGNALGRLETVAGGLELVGSIAVSGLTGDSVTGWDDLYATAEEPAGGLLPSIPFTG